MDFNQKVLEMREDIIQSTQEIIKIPSVEGTPEKGMPFGRDTNAALIYALNLSEKMGFKTKNLDGYIGYAEFGEGSETVGVLVHLDVVPAGNNWTHDPFGAEIDEGKIYGRGAIDDKGPAIAALYALKAVKDSGATLSKKVRIIFGINEESGWGCIEHYLQHDKAPDLAFTPDADFPVIHGEKGILIFNLEKDLSPSADSGVRVMKITGGHRPNMVPDYAEAYLKSDEPLKDNLCGYLQREMAKLEIVEDRGQTIVKSHGISAHGSLPETGQNAISELMLFLNTLNLAEGGMKDFIRFYCDKIGREYYGESIGCELNDKESGRLVFNVGMIEADEKKAKVTVNIRYPVTYTDEQVFTHLQQGIGNSGIKIVKGSHQKPIYLPKDHPLVRTLMRVYEEATGDKREPITIGGGTYARAMDNAVAFGPLFPGQPELAHQKDEHIAIEDLMKITQIYAKALYELAK